VVAIVAGSAVVVPWADRVPALLQCWYGGMDGGHGFADVLLGRVEPAGRLPFTVPTDERHLPFFDRDARHAVYDRWHGWWLLERNGRTPAFPFGFGLAYTTFELGPPSVTAAGDGELHVTCTVRNTGERDGTDVVQVYGGRLDGPEDGRPGRRLLGFARVEVPAGAERAVDIRVPAERLAIRDVERHRMVVAAGTYLVDVARHATDPGAHRLTVTLGRDGRP
jgi:beta-glucosidase